VSHPKAELARRSARKPSLGRGVVQEDRQRNLTSLAAFSQLRCTAIKNDTDDEYESGQDTPAEIMVLCSDIHPLCYGAETLGNKFYVRRET
jgi:hypothetical protein